MKPLYNFKATVELIMFQLLRLISIRKLMVRYIYYTSMIMSVYVLVLLESFPGASK